jgi:hypothetical protein
MLRLIIEVGRGMKEILLTEFRWENVFGNVHFGERKGTWQMIEDES